MIELTLEHILAGCGRLDCLSFFKEQEISDEQLPALTLEDLKEIGIEKLGHRKAILLAIQTAMSKRASQTDQASLLPVPQEIQRVEGRPKIFLSYGRKDALEIAQRLSRDLEAVGFEVWIDVKKIGSGSLWQREIETGLREAQVVVSLLSPHAVRRAGDSDPMDSICLDEIAFARTGSPPTPVVPAMVAPCEPPFIIYRLDYVHLIGWRDSEEEYRKGFERLVAGIREALAGRVSYRLWEDRLRPLDFSDYMARKRQGFVGRDWLFEEIDLWRFESEERALLITGDPGAGKSTIVAQLVHANPNGQVIGYHCCQADELDTLRPSRFVQSLAAMIASRMPAYAQQLEVPSVKEALDDKRCEADAGGALLEGIIQPLQKIAAPEEGVRYILVDALDEALGHVGSINIVDMLASRLERLPSWLRIVATTRNEPAVIQRLSGLRAKSIDAADPRNLDDVANYIRRRIAQPKLAERLVEARVSADQAVLLISAKSSGNFLYAVNALDGIARDFYSFGSLDALPRGLDGLYLDFFRRVFGSGDSALYEQAKPLLQVLSAALEPLSRAEIAAATSLGTDEELPGIVRRISQLLSRKTRSTGEETLSFYHKSLADWLIADPESNPFAVSLSKGRSRLAEFCRKELSERRSAPVWYVRRHAVEHFLEVGEWDDVVSALCDLDFIQTRARFHELSAMLLDYAEALKLLPEGHAAREQKDRRMAEASRYADELIAYAVTSRRIRSGDLAPVPQPPRPVQSVRLWTKEEIAAERKRITETPNRADLLEAFRQFVATHTAPLQKLSSHQGFAANLARNSAPAGPVHSKGLECLEVLGCVAINRIFSIHETYNPMEVCKAVLEGHEGPVSACRMTGDGRLAVSGGVDKTLRIWDAATGEGLRVLAGHEDAVTCVGLSVDGARIVSGSKDKTLRIWDAGTGECLRVLAGHQDTVTCVSLSVDGARIVSGGADGNLRIWDAGTGEHLKEFPRSEKAVTCVDFSSDGRKIASGDLTEHPRLGTVRIWDSETGECLRILKHPGVHDMKFTADGTKLYTAGRRLLLWDVTTGECLKFFAGHQAKGCIVITRKNGRIIQRKQWFTSVCATSDGAKVVSGGGDCTIRIWDAESGDFFHTPRRREFICNRFRLSVPAHKVAAAGVVPIPEGWSHNIRVLATDDGRCLTELSGHSDEVYSLCWSEDGKTIVSAGVDETVRIWDAKSGQCIKTLRKSPNEVRCLHAGFDGKHFLTEAMDQSLHLWDSDSGKCVQSFVGHGSDVEFVAWHPNGKTLVSYGGGRRTYLRSNESDRREERNCKRNELRLWDVPHGACLKVVENVRSVDLGRGGSQLAVSVRRGARLSERNLYILDAHNGEVLKTYPPGKRLIGLVRLSSDGRRVVASEGRSLLCFDTETWECQHEFDGHGGSVDFISLSEDGLSAISACSDNEIRLWDLLTGECSSVAFLRGLRPERLSVDWIRGRIVVNREDGFLDFFSIENLQSGPLITTARREILSEDLPAGAVTARPSCCGQFISIPEPTADLIERWSHQGGEGGYADPELLLKCPSCSTPLRMNPFFIDVPAAN